MKVKHVFFDLDHTLWDFEVNSAAAYKKIFNDYDIDLNVNKFLNYYKGINLRYWKLYREDKISRDMLRYRRLKDTFDFLKYSVLDETINKLTDAYLEYLPNYNKLFDGTHEILTYLDAKYKLHIITNGLNSVQIEKLKKSRIDKYFDKIITSESVGVKKPNSKIFEFALKFADANPNESVMIGDNWEADIMGAKNKGMYVIYCNFDNEQVDDSIPSIDSLEDIRNYL